MAAPSQETPAVKPAPSFKTRSAQSLVKAELAFAKKAEELGTTAAFLDVLDDLGVLFRPGPVNGKAWLRVQKPSSSKLAWFPSFVEVSEAGDLGYSTGPYQWRAEAESKQVVHGHFVSVWGHRGGAWKLLLDMGSSHAAPGEADPVFEPENTKGTAKADGQPPFSAEELQNLEKTFSNLASVKGILSAYNTYLAADARFYRADSQPTTQLDVIRKALEKVDGIVKWTCLGSAVARSNDLGYAYGIREYVPNPAAVPKPETMRKQAARNYIFLHIWKRQPTGRWKVVLDIEDPMP
ncbi:MAG: nuclear transport factor 2 family protein [Holophagaceae bacterium]|nr:nuclear transport factor 2 family protein [Holophagaceae bacterium]